MGIHVGIVFHQQKILNENDDAAGMMLAHQFNLYLVLYRVTGMMLTSSTFSLFYIVLHCVGAYVQVGRADGVRLCTRNTMATREDSY